MPYQQDFWNQTKVMRELETAYIVLTDKSGETALSICLPVDSVEFSELLRERYLMSRLVSEASLGIEVGDELDGHRKGNLRKKYDKGAI